MGVINYQELNDMCREWSELTGTNNRSVALLAISDYFCIDTLAAEFRAIDQRQKNIGYCRFDIFIDRLQVEKELFNEIRRLYGDMVYNLVYKCC